MKSIGAGVLVWALVCAHPAVAAKIASPAETSVDKAARWLVSVQGKDGGWGQDGGETSYVRMGERLETSGNDVANTAVAALALVHAANATGKHEYRQAAERGIRFILSAMQKAPGEGLAITPVTGTQIQRKLGPYIDTFLTARLFSEVDGTLKDAWLAKEVRRNLEVCVARIEKHQLKDGSWNMAGGWAPVLGTSMAARSLYDANRKGVAVKEAVMARADQYAKAQTTGTGAGVGSGMGGGVVGGVIGGVAAASAGVPLYAGAQALEQLSRTEADRKKNAVEIRKITGELGSAKFVSGFGSMGGEEFFSYLNISDSLHRTGGEPWTNWNNRMKTQLVKLQNDDGTWAGHHCITGRVAVTSAAMLTLLVEKSKT